MVIVQRRKVRITIECEYSDCWGDRGGLVTPRRIGTMVGCALSGESQDGVGFENRTITAEILENLPDEVY